MMSLHYRLIFRMTFLSTFVLSIFNLENANAQEKVKVTILGVHHFHNPGADMFNIHQDNVKSAHRQKEILELVNKLMAFQPTKVVIEKVYGDTVQQHLYEGFLAHRDESKLTENEKEQVGFRIAARMKHKQIFPFDYRQGMDLGELEELAQKDPEIGARFQGMMQEVN